MFVLVINEEVAPMFQHLRDKLPSSSSQIVFKIFTRNKNSEDILALGR